MENRQEWVIIGREHGSRELFAKLVRGNRIIFEIGLKNS